MIKDRFSRNVFLVAGIYGLIVLLPGYFGEKTLAQKMPPAVTHPEFFYGFFGVAVAWQVAFLIIARDPQRFRPIIPAAILEKLIYCVACAVRLFWGGFRSSWLWAAPEILFWERSLPFHISGSGLRRGD